MIQILVEKLLILLSVVLPLLLSCLTADCEWRKELILSVIKMCVGV